MGQVEVILLDDRRASPQPQQRKLRQHSHDCFDRWLDTLDERTASEPATLDDCTDMVWELRQRLMGHLTETLVAHTHAQQAMAHRAPCPMCKRPLEARR